MQKVLNSLWVFLPGGKGRMNLGQRLGLVQHFSLWASHRHLRNIWEASKYVICTVPPTSDPLDLTGRREACISA